MDTYILEEMKELNNLIKEYDVILPDGWQETDLGNVRRPLVLYRGKPITREQAMQLITGEESLFGEGSCCGNMWNPREGRGVLKNIFYRQGYSWLSTWVYTDGTIGGNLICLEKYPELFEIIPEHIHLAKKYPFLDMVVSYTLYDECCCYLCDVLAEDEEEKEYCIEGMSERCGCKDCEVYSEQLKKYSKYSYEKELNFEKEYFQSWNTAHVRSDAADAVELTIWIHEGKTEILFGEKAKKKFEEYNTQYSSKEYDFMFSSNLYNDKKTCICDKTYVEDCFEFIGKPRSLVDEYITCGFISPFHESAVVVTKEWVTEQYNRYIAKK